LFIDIFFSLFLWLLYILDHVENLESKYFFMGFDKTMGGPGGDGDGR
jgi:hypothetical protein